MFDISFFELLVIFVVALLVLGPDKLPGAIRTGALWFGRAKRSFNKVRTEIEQQLNADEIRRQLHNESILADIEQARKNADQLVKDTQKQLDQAQDGVNKTISSVTGKGAASTGATPAETQNVPVVTNSAVEGEPTYTLPVTPAPEKSEAAAAEDTAVESTEGTKEAAESDAASEPTGTEAQESEKPAPVQGVYNTPPTGRVTVQGGKFRVGQPDPVAKPDNKDA